MDFIIKSHTSANKARTLAQIVEVTHELTDLQQQNRKIPTCKKDKDYVLAGLFFEEGGSGRCLAEDDNFQFASFSCV